MIRFSDKVKSISIWYANLNGYALPLSPEQLLNAVVAWVDEYGGDHIYFDNPPEGTEVNVGDIKISTATWEVQQWNGREWESYGSIAGVAATLEIGDVETLPAGSDAYVRNRGTEFAAVLDIGLPAGETGPQGATGQQGAQGEPGRDGAAATIEVAETTTLPAGSSATVENIGTSSAARLKFGIPRGENGQTGQVVFDIINITGSGTISSDDLAKIASSPEGVALVDENNYRYKISRSDGANYIFTADNINSGDIQLYVVTVNSSSGAYTRTSAEASSPLPSFTADTNGTVSASENGFSFVPSNMNFGKGSYEVESNLPIKPGDGITMDVSSDGKSVLIGVDANEMFTEVELSGSSGVVDDEVLAILQRDTPAVYIKKDGEIYYYSDNMSASGYLVFTHVGMTNSNAYYVKTITITITAKTWSTTSKQFANFDANGTYANLSAGKDGDGNVIADTYATKDSIPTPGVTFTLVGAEESFDFNTAQPGRSMKMYGADATYMPNLSNAPAGAQGGFNLLVVGVAGFAGIQYCWAGSGTSIEYPKLYMRKGHWSNDSRNVVWDSSWTEIV